MEIKQHGFVYWGIIVLAAGFAVLLIALTGREMLGMGSAGETGGPALMDRDRWERLSQMTQRDWNRSVDCLFICDGDGSGEVYRSVLGPMLDQMKVTYLDVTSEAFRQTDLDGCRSAMICTSDLSVFGEELRGIMDWVRSGGHVFLAAVEDDRGSFLNMISQDLGIVSMDTEPVEVSGLRLARPFMIGADREYSLQDHYSSSYQILLGGECEVYLESADGRSIPLVWRKKLGDGTIVAANLGCVTKDLMGIYASCYSLLEDAFAWPVINGSAFFLDDFPGPVSNAVDRKIKEDYGVNVRRFYAQVWWPDMLAIARQYGLKYTGSVIEDYSMNVSAPFDGAGLDTAAFRSYGMGILRQGGEIGFHGYNHMPLALEGFDYQGLEENYIPWPSTADMEAGLRELTGFCSRLYPNSGMQTYVPPSGILSDEARQLIAGKFPEIRVISGVYVPDGPSYTQDFDVDGDGIVNVPRIVSGCQPGGTGYLAAFSELNFHYVNSHSQHPYDVLDEQGEDLGWGGLKDAFCVYLDWLYGAAPDLRNMTAGELAGAVQRYDAVTVRQTIYEGQLVLELGNFEDEACFLVRLNGYEAGAVAGGTLKRQADGLYLLKAERERVTIGLE